jgi:hypothetical protein
MIWLSSWWRASAPVLFVLGNDLQEHAAGEVLTGLGVTDLEILAIDDQPDGRLRS